MFPVPGTSGHPSGFSAELGSQAIPVLDRTLSESSTCTQASSLFDKSVDSLSSSLATTPYPTPNKESKAGESYFGQTESTATPTISEIYNRYYRNTPDYRIDSVSCPKPPLSNFPRPLDKRTAKGEAAFRAKIKVMYLQASSYEESLDVDPSAFAFLEGDLKLLKRNIWEYHMRDENPAPTGVIFPRLVHTCNTWHLMESIQIFIGYLIFFFVPVLSLSGNNDGKPSVSWLQSRLCITNVCMCLYSNSYP